MSAINLENEIASLEYAQAFKKLGLFTTSPFTWVNAAWTYEINSSLEKKLTEARIKLCFGDIRMIKDVYASWPSPSVGMLCDWLPQRITLFPDNANGEEGNPFNSFRLRIEKCQMVRENQIETHYVANYRCDSTEIQGKDAWMERTLCQHNHHDIKLADCLSKLVLHLLENNFVQIQTNFIPENAASLVLGK